MTQNLPQKDQKRLEQQRVTCSSTFDEEKCRNVLVRYCAHIPRNYQYRDGVRLVFLVLRDHLGDENLGKAGGVLYEMIEVDCQYSDDPGAAFQRWRHHHMNRHADLELPHVPHLTTVSTRIVPTEVLTIWRIQHSERYRTRLSDHAAEPRVLKTAQSCIQHRKSWAIEHTTFVSSRDGGTHPLRNWNNRDLHKMRMSSNKLQRGRLIKEQSIDLGDSWILASDAPPDSPAGDQFASRAAGSKRHLSISSSLESIISKLKPAATCKGAARSATTSSRLSTRRHSAGLAPRLGDQRQVSRVQEEKIPNAVFARKFDIFTDGNELPPTIRELPVAEDKAVKIISGRLTANEPHARGFLGPFTPQLWYDGGLDFRQRRK